MKNTNQNKLTNRLATYRQWAEESKHTNDWRKFTWVNNRVRTGYRKTERQFTMSDNGRIYADSKDTIGEYMGDWSSFATYRDMRDTSGFYADNWQNATIKGGVTKLRCSKGVFYVPVTYYDEWDGVTLYIGESGLVPKGSDETEHEKAQKEAANTAFYRAEKEADIARDDDARYQADEQIAEARCDIHTLNKKALALLAEIKKAGSFSPAICNALTDNVRYMLTERKKLFALISERKENYWTAVSY